MLRIGVRRAAASLLFPWFSRSIPSIEREKLPEPLEKGIQTTFGDGFGEVYSHIMKSIVEGQVDALEGSLEPTLYVKLTSDLSYLSRQGLTLKLVNETEPVVTSFCNVKHNFGVPINRSEVRDFGFYVVHTAFSPYVSKKDTNMHLLDIFKLPTLPNMLSIASLMKQEVLQLHCLVRTNLKLAVINAAGETVQACKEGEEEHLLQFEASTTEKLEGNGIFTMPNPIDMQNWQWVLTDVDQELAGNPYKVVRSL